MTHTSSPRQTGGQLAMRDALQDGRRGDTKHWRRYARKTFETRWAAHSASAEPKVPTDPPDQGEYAAVCRHNTL